MTQSSDQIEQAKNQQVELALQALQQALMKAGDWSKSGISDKALASQQPFCLDTMNFSQWLQFVFIPNIQALINSQQPLPCLMKDQGLEPMAIECYKKMDESHRAILMVICQIDELLQSD